MQPEHFGEKNVINKTMKSPWKSRASLVGAATLFAAVAGCGGGGTPDTAVVGNSAGNTAENSSAVTTGADGQLTGAGATFPYPLYSKWFDTYNKNKGVRINYQSVGSGAGIQQLKNQTVNFGASDAPLNDEDLKKMPAPVVHIPTVAGAVAVIYNLQEVPKLRLDGQTLAGMFLGQIKRWNDPKIAALNPGASLPNRAVTVTHRSDGSGTSYIFTNYLKAVSPEWSSQVGAGKSVEWPVGIGGKGNDGVAAVVKQTAGAIGYAELAYAIENKIAYAALRNKAGQFVEPSVASTIAAAEGASAAMQKDVRTPIVNEPGAKAYPIAGFTYILVYKKQQDAAKGKVLTEFLNWAMTDGQGMAEPLLYAPLPASVAKLNQTTIQSIQ
jgi:phosphate transport system substrate-binding protein